MGKERTIEVNEMESLIDLTSYVETITSKYQEKTMAVFVGTIIKAWAEDNNADVKRIALNIAEAIIKAEKLIEKMEMPEELMKESDLKWIIGAGALNFGENEGQGK